jgi:hypothetical protein
MTYPITAALHAELDNLGLGASRLGGVAKEFIGEYEHGSADIETLLTDEQRTENVMSDDHDEVSWLMSKEDLVKFAANVVVDFVLCAREVQ